MNKHHGPARLQDLDLEQRQCLLDDQRTAEAHGMLDDLEARCDMDVTALRAILPGRSPWRDVVGKYTQGRIWNTGGNCKAWRIDCDDRGYLMITDTDDAALPEDDARVVAVGRYDYDGRDVPIASNYWDNGDGVSKVPVDALERFLDRELASANPYNYWRGIALEALQKAYEDYCALNDIPCGSASDLIETRQFPKHDKMLQAFVEVWERVE